MSKIKGILPMLLTFIVLIVFIVVISNKYSTDYYDKKIEKVNKSIETAQLNIDVYNKSMDVDFKVEANHVEEDGLAVANLQKKLSKDSVAYIKKYPDATDAAPTDEKTITSLMKFVKEGTNDVGLVTSPWSSLVVPRIDFSYFFSEDNVNEFSVMWCIYNNDKLMNIYTAKYDKKERLFSGLKISSIEEVIDSLAEFNSEEKSEKETKDKNKNEDTKVENESDSNMSLANDNSDILQNLQTQREKEEDNGTEEE